MNYVILLVDDNPADRAIFRRILSHEGVRLHELDCGAEVVRTAREIRPHAVILDVNLPDTDGFALCRALRAEPELSGMPIVLLTVRDRNDDIETGFQAGATDYLVKDASPKEILARVKNLAEAHRQAMVSDLDKDFAILGRLQAGFVHEFKGPLAVIRSQAEMVRTGLPADAKVGDHERLQVIVNNVRLLQVWLDQFLALLRQVPGRPSAILLTRLVRQAAEEFRQQFPDCALRLDVPPHLPPIPGDSVKLSMLLHAIFTNAHDAVRDAVPPRPCILTVTVSDAAENDRPGQRITVRDNGPGIDPQFLERIFEPSFTTKRHGGGLGLFFANHIALQHEGLLRARNSPPHTTENGNGHGNGHGDLECACCKGGPGVTELAPSGAEFSLWLPATLSNASEPTQFADPAARKDASAVALANESKHPQRSASSTPVLHTPLRHAPAESRIEGIGD